MTILMAITALAGAPATAELAAYPELSAEALLPPIMLELKRTLADPYSIRDFTMCPSRNVKMKDGRPMRWYVSIAFNSKNSFGGYTGYKTYAVIFRNGRITGGLTATQFEKSDGISGLLNDMAARRMANCPPVADETVQRLMSPGASSLKEIR